MRPATPIGVGSRVIQTVRGGCTIRHIPARPEQTQSPISSPSIDTLRAAKLAAQERLDDARRKLSSAQSEFRKARKAERTTMLAFIEAYDNAMEGRHG
jgi:hypothetical protein